MKRKKPRVLISCAGVRIVEIPDLAPVLERSLGKDAIGATRWEQVAVLLNFRADADDKPRALIGCLRKIADGLAKRKRRRAKR